MGNLYRSSDEGIVSGVCAGLAHSFDLNMTGLRVLFVLAAIFSGFPIVVYCILGLVLKERPTRGGID